jgi:hypothetical protein
MLIAALLAAAAASAPATATQKAAKIAITPASKNGAVIIKTQNLLPPPTYKSAYRLTFMPYDAANQAMMSGLFNAFSLAAQPKMFLDGYLVSDLKPGTYVLTDFSRQDFWALCFHASSIQFTLKPGEVLYLGELNAAKHLAELEYLAVSSGMTTLRGSRLAHFFDNISPPALTPADEAGVAAVAEVVKVAMPATTVTPRAAIFTPARFGTGSDLFGTQRACGGWHNKSAK